jgi:chloramphenicol-sensitive protein RarD
VFGVCGGHGRLAIPLSDAPPPPTDPPRALLSAVVAFLLWGVLPVYWKLAGHFSSEVVVCQRLVWTTLWVAPLLWFGGEWRTFLEALRTRRLLRLHAWSATMLTANWSLFIWATQHGRIVEASLGYFLNPLLNVAIGRVLFGEQVSRWRKASIALAGAGVLVQMILVGHMPWIALSIAVTFSLYGVARKQSPLGSLSGLAVESVLVLPLALAVLGWLARSGVPVWGKETAADFFLMFLSGPVTAAPLLAFAYAARHLRFTTLGLLQFLAPTGQFLIGALVYGEPVTMGLLVSFVLIWLGVGVFCAEQVLGKDER